MVSNQQINEGKQLHERVANDSAEKTDSLFRHILLVTMSTMALLITLHKDTIDDCWIKGLYILSLVLFAIVGLTSLYIISSQARMVGKARNDIEKDLYNLQKDGIPMKTRYGHIDKCMGYVCNACLIAFGLSLISLTTYAILYVMY